MGLDHHHYHHYHHHYHYHSQLYMGRLDHHHCSHHHHYHHHPSVYVGRLDHHQGNHYHHHYPSFYLGRLDHHRCPRQQLLSYLCCSSCHIHWRCQQQQARCCPARWSCCSRRSGLNDGPRAFNISFDSHISRLRLTPRDRGRVTSNHMTL